jgi:ribosome biogenesis protein Nip4
MRNNNFLNFEINIDNLKSFLFDFGVFNEKTDLYFKGKKLFRNNYGVYLRKKNFDKKQVFNDDLIFINLKDLVPTTYLLNFIYENTNNFLEINEKNALKFTYGKDLIVEDKKIIGFLVKNSMSYIVLVFNKSVIGLGKINIINKGKLIIKNIFNIGQYLREK